MGAFAPRSPTRARRRTFRRARSRQHQARAGALSRRRVSGNYWAVSIADGV